MGGLSFVACAVVALSACTARAPDGVFGCQTSSDCPKGQTCNRNFICSSYAIDDARGDDAARQDAENPSGQTSSGIGVADAAPARAGASGYDSSTMEIAAEGKGGASGLGRSGGGADASVASGSAGMGGTAAEPTTQPSSADAGPPSSSMPTLGDPCSVANAHSCERPASRDTLLCDGTRWTRGMTCPEDFRCDRKVGFCAKVPAGCESVGQASCTNTSILPGAPVTGPWAVARCGPDLTTLDLQPCKEPTAFCESGQCVAGVCPAPAADSLLVNSDFDTDLRGWRADGVSATWSNRDLTNCARSGSVALQSAGGQEGRGLSQCLANVPSAGQKTGISFASWVDRNLTAWVGYELRQGKACEGEGHGGPVLSPIEGRMGWAISSIELPDLSMHPGFQSIEIVLKPAGSAPVYFDSVRSFAEPSRADAGVD